MDNQTISNVQFLYVCNYITSLGIILSSKSLITIIDEPTQTVPVLNALFHYLDEFSNATEVNIQLLRQISNENDLYKEAKDTKLGMRYVNETYHYITDAGLLAHYGNITEYLSGIINGTENITFSAFKDVVAKDLSKNAIKCNFCTSKNSTLNSTLLAIEKIFKDYVWPTFMKVRNTVRNLNGGQVLTRNKRQILGTDDEDGNTDTEIHSLVNDLDMPRLMNDFDSDDQDSSIDHEIHSMVNGLDIPRLINDFDSDDQDNNYSSDIDHELHRMVNDIDMPRLMNDFDSDNQDNNYNNKVDHELRRMVNDLDIPKLINDFDSDSEENDFNNDIDYNPKGFANDVGVSRSIMDFDIEDKGSFVNLKPTSSREINLPEGLRSSVTEKNPNRDSVSADTNFRLKYPPGTSRKDIILNRYQ